MRCSHACPGPARRARRAARPDRRSARQRLSVEHLREAVSLHLRETAIELTLETRGPGHTDAGPRHAGRRRLRGGRRLSRAALYSRAGADDRHLLLGARHRHTMCAVHRAGIASRHADRALRDRALLRSLGVQRGADALEQRLRVATARGAAGPRAGRRGAAAFAAPRLHGSAGLARAARRGRGHLRARRSRRTSSPSRRPRRASSSPTTRCSDPATTRSWRRPATGRPSTSPAAPEPR